MGNFDSQSRTFIKDINNEKIKNKNDIRGLFLKFILIQRRIFIDFHIIFRTEN